MSQVLLTSPLGLPAGALKPRVETHPQYVTSFAPEAAELMARAGRPLDPWQLDSLTLMLAVREDGQWACFECCEWVSRQNGKGGILEARALAGFFLIGEELIMWSAHEYKTAMEAFRRVKALIRALGVQVDVAGNLFDVDGILVKVNNTNGEECFERLDTGARIKFIARTKGSGRGFSGDINIIDETFAYTLEQQEALLYTLSARPNPQIIYTSSPPLDGETGEIMFGLRRRGDPTLPRDPGEEPWEQDPSLAYRDWGLPGDLDHLDNVDLDDMALAAATNPALGIRITHETITRQRRATRANPTGYARERFGIWPRQLTSGSVIDAQLWADLADRESKRQGDVAFALAIAQDRSWSAIAAVGLRADGLKHWEVIAHRAGTDWLVRRCVKLKAKHNPVAFGIDERGPAGSVITALSKVGIKEPTDRDKPERGDLAVTGASDMAAAFGMFIDSFKQKDLRHRDQPQLNGALAAAKKRTIGDGAEAWGRKGSADISPLEAVTLANWAYETRAHLVIEDGPPNLW